MANTRSAVRVLLVILLVVASLIFLSNSVLAQTTSTWGGGAGNWSDCPPGGDALWSTCPDPPQGLGWPDGNFNAVIDGGPVTATSASIVNLSIGSGGSLVFPAGGSGILDITGTSIVNDGSITLAGANGMEIVAPATVTLSGTASVTMAGNNFIGSPGGGASLIVQEPVHGYGTFASYTVLTNQSKINAAGGTLFMQPVSVTNIGTMEASSGGILEFASGTATNYTNTGGIIEALSGGTVQIDDAIITGGTLTTVGTGVIQANDASVLNSLTNSGAVLVSYASLQGSVTNNGTIKVPTSDTLFLSGNVTLTGSGSMALSGRSTLQQISDGGNSLTNQSLIEGSGTIIQLPVTNQGTINANSKGNTLYLDDGPLTNTGTLEASGGGILELETVVNNSGGTVEAQAGSTVILGGDSSSSFSGGTLTTSGTGVIESENVLLDGTVNVPNNAGKLEVNDQYDLYIQGTIENTGTITVSDRSFVILNEPATLTGSGKLVMSPNSLIFGSGLAFTNQSTIEGAGDIGNSNPMPITNNGTILANSTSPLVIGADSSGFTNTGKLTANSGSTLTVEAPFNNLSEAGALSGGTYAVSGTLGLPAAIVSNAANITLTGASAEILNTDASTNALATIASNASTGTLSLQSGQSLATTTALKNAGKVTVGAASSFNLGGHYTQTAGTTTVDGTLKALGITLEKGALVGKGTLAAAVASTAATVIAGDSSTKPGTLAVNGSYTQQAKAVFDIYVGGTTAGTYGDLAVTNGVSLGGMLNIKLVNGFVPTVGDSFTILTGSAITGTFATVNGTSINSSEHFEVNYTSTAVTLTVASGT
jgi:hypothetical protein